MSAAKHSEPYILVDLIPPGSPARMCEAQWFTFPAPASTWWPSAELGPVLGAGRQPLYAGMQVQPTLAVALTEVETPAYVPVMLWDEPADIRITALRPAAREGLPPKKIWSAEWRYGIPPAQFPRAPPSPSWQPTADGTGLRMTKSHAGVAREKWALGPQQWCRVPVVNPDISVVMGISKATLENGAALTYYRDRVWALTTLLVFVSPTYHTLLYAQSA